MAQVAPFVASLDVGSAVGVSEYSVEIVGDDRLQLVLATDGAPAVVLGMQQLGATPEGTYTLVLEIVYPSASVRLVGPVGAELTATLTTPLDAPLRLEISSSEADLSVEYAAYTGPAPD